MINMPGSSFLSPSVKFDNLMVEFEAKIEDSICIDSTSNPALDDSWVFYFIDFIDSASVQVVFGGGALL